ncbi:2-oxo-4-hydroxy-4-carboxy-5-ureidoimidazoline decarboxylase [Streptomyces sp. 549]|uniref:2-oxo-4-hydroxy-4-carboxy-5-ureidoimidazoline decarboxylase n=1 Tax=Streptomyces sp. 549 TaxID=3049076 RepID=UPI0024C292F3|nr:2-oxo-4-hydroxy-4-carboxy-5-ureidoimidazoline decarboxylase [Streptomyces sp. 549]MDK1472727.1 2-oxo-4-hydroxy-4-carboxy-5-ureidoimidazoline decarboxylase [Streptomyces sp. 549]
MEPTRLPAPRASLSPLDRLNDADRTAAEAALLACCGSRRWAWRLAGHRPYPDAESLLAAAEEASYDLTFADLAEALAAESGRPLPECGDAAPAAAPDAPGARAARTALEAARAAYESRFGHAFVICLDELPPTQRLDGMLAGIRTRLGNEADEERAVSADELRRLARGRLLRLVVHDVTVRSPSVPD